MKKLRMNLLAAGILVVLIVAGFGVAWSVHPETIITNLTASIGGGAYTLSSAMTDIARKYHPWLRISTAETPGYIYNLRAHDKDPKKWKNTIVSSNHAVIYLAEQGKAPFKKKITGYKFLGNYNTLTRWLVTLNPNIKGPKDLIGKKIALGFKTQIDWAVTPDYLLQYGWKIKDKLNIVYMGSNPAIGALIDGTVDVAQIDAYMNPFTGEVVGGKPTVDLIASGKKVYHIPWGKDSIEKTKKETGYPVSSITIRAGAFKGWLKEDIVTWVYTNCFAAKDVFPADLAYELIRLCLQNVGKFKEYHAMGKLLSPEALCYGFTQKDLHPGALKAYKEAGLKIPEK